MRFHEICIHRPVFTIVLSTVVTLLGLIGLRLIGVREYPATESPVVSINANYGGANAAAIEAQITEPIEEGPALLRDSVRQNCHICEYPDDLADVIERQRLAGAGARGAGVHFDHFKIPLPPVPGW